VLRDVDLAGPAEHVVVVGGRVVERVGGGLHVAARVVGVGPGVGERVGDGLRVPGGDVLAVGGGVPVGVLGSVRLELVSGVVVGVVGGVGAGCGAGSVAVGVGDLLQVPVGVVAEGPQPLLRGEHAGQVSDVAVQPGVVGVGGVRGVGGGVVVGL